MHVYSCTSSTPIEPFHMIMNSDDYVVTSGFGSLQDLQARLVPALRSLPVLAIQSHLYTKYIELYFSGDTHALSNIPHVASGTPFQEVVWQHMAAIPHGETHSYTDLADAAGHPKAIRSAASTCKNNRPALRISCHRVLPKSCKTGDYYYYYGADRKEFLLAHERSGEK